MTEDDFLIGASSKILLGVYNSPHSRVAQT